MMTNNDVSMSNKIYDEAFRPSDKTLEKCADFIAIVRQLRRDCPWDREQTHESIRHLLIEECYETVEAIDNKDWDELKKELGDLFLHVIFNAVIAEENGTFELGDVLDEEILKDENLAGLDSGVSMRYRAMTRSTRLRK